MRTYFRQELATALPEFAEEEMKAMGWTGIAPRGLWLLSKMRYQQPSPAKSKQAADSAILKDRYDHSLQGLALLQCA